jgi:creatinine amidohydrolase
MNWLELTSDALKGAIDDVQGLCLLPIGCIERHGPHLPLATDLLLAEEVARRAADQEPAIVFPTYPFGKIYVAKPHAGAFVTPPELLFPLLEATLDEIGRNGFSKILIVNWHGGNRDFLKTWTRMSLDRPRSYAVYITNPFKLGGEDLARWEAMSETDYDGHAGETETSAMLALRPDLVDRTALQRAEDEGARLGRLDHLPDLATPLDWYADHPTHYAGDGRYGTPQKGQFVLEAATRKVVGQMRVIKADGALPQLLEEFYRRSR